MVYSDVGPGRRSDAARTANEPVDIAPRYTCSAGVRRRRRRRRRCRAQATVATTPADGRRSPISRRWSPAAAASTRAAVGGSCTNTIVPRHGPRPSGRQQSGALPPHQTSPFDRIRHRGCTMTSFPAEVLCIRTPYPVGGIYRSLGTGSTVRHGRRQRVRCRNSVRNAP